MISLSARSVRNCYLVPLLCFGMFQSIQAQFDILPAITKLPDAVQNQAYPAPYTGKPYPLTFTLSNGVIPSSWDWIPLGGTADISTLGIDVNASTGALNYISAGSPRIANGTAGTLCRGRLEARDNMGNLIRDREYTMFVRNSAPPLCSAPKEFVILLDRSGSMNIPVDATNDRWDELKNTVSTYLPQLNDALGQTGILKVYYFNGAAASLKYTGNWGPNWSNRTYIEQTLFQEGAPLVNITPSGGTPIGDAICDAVQGSAAANNRTFILFTDGHQTVPPDYNSGTHEIPCTTGGTIDLDNSPNNQIKIFTIGTTGSDAPLLQILAQPHGQFAQSNTGGSAELNIFFTSTIPWSLYDCGSPRIIDYQHATLLNSRDTIIHTFKINRMIDNLAIRLSKIRGRMYGTYLSLYKDGEPVLNTPVENNDLNIRYFIEFNDPYEAGGNWEVRVNTTGGLEYELSVMAEDKYLKTRLDAGEQGLVYAGDPIHVNLNLLEAGQGIDNAVVRAILLKPGEDLGDLAARTNMSANSLPSTTSGDPLDNGQAKIDSLLRNAAFVNQVKNDTSGTVLTLTPAGNGNYTGTFTGNTLTGTYRVVTLIEGQRPGLGAYQGWETKCVLVDFSRPEDIDLKQSIVDLGVIDGIHRYGLSIQPVNKFGKRIGPAQTRRIGVQLSKGTVSPLQDGLDGTYTAQLRIPEGANPLVTITVIDPLKPVIREPLSVLLGHGSTHPFGISLHFGTAFPIGNFDLAADAGLALEADLTWKLNPNWALEAVIGRYTFEPDLDVSGGTVGVLYSQAFNNGSYGWHAGAGLGAFQPINQDWAFGYALHAGIHKHITTHLDGVVDLGLTGVPKPERNFVKATLGVKYFF
ncbi:MAG: VWA domain-containing protein [Saprospiraceae bacterium]|nr:VWA domain-containing protein [Saprospiraceae bacterium]